MICIPSLLEWRVVWSSGPFKATVRRGSAPHWQHATQLLATRKTYILSVRSCTETSPARV